MKYYIKHIILPMLAALACATSCTSDPETGMMSPAGTSEELEFEVESEPLARASVTTGENLTDNPFMIFGDLNRTGEYYPGLKTMFNGDTVTFRNNRWDYGVKQYWLMGQEHSFVAIHPYDIKGDLTGLKYSGSQVSFSYELPEDISTAKDLLVATHRRKYTLDSTGPIKFEFKHLLSRINIAPTLHEVLMYDDNPELQAKDPLYKDEYILFHSLEIQGIKTKASFSFIPAQLSGSYSTNECVVSYGIDGEEKLNTVKVDFKEPNLLTNKNQPISILNDNDAVIVLPQSFAETSESKIILTYTVNDDEPLRTITIPLKNITWEIGKIYTYKFTIEKAYTGQIKAGSLEIEADDFRLPEKGDDSWINGGEEITYDFSDSGTKINGVDVKTSENE